MDTKTQVILLNKLSKELTEMEQNLKSVKKWMLHYRNAIDGKAVITLAEDDSLIVRYE